MRGCVWAALTRLLLLTPLALVLAQETRLGGVMLSPKCARLGVGLDSEGEPPLSRMAPEPVFPHRDFPAAVFRPGPSREELWLLPSS